MAFNRLSTVACPFSPKCILSKGFFLAFFFRIFAPLILERTHGKLWIRHIWSCEIEKKGHSRKEGEEEKKKMRMMVCLVELFSQCVLLCTKPLLLVISFLALKHVRTQWITKWSTKRPATCLLLAEAETKFFEIFQIQRTERSNILFHF